MTAALEAPAGRARLDPFAFISDTSFRFALLLLVVGCADGRRWFGIATDLSDLASLRTCMHGNAAWSDLLAQSDPLQCYRAILPTVLFFISLGLALLIATTTIIYVAYPRWQIWRLELEPLDPTEVPELAMELDALCRTAGLRRNPEFWWNPLGSGSPLAFGTGRRRLVALTGTVAGQFYKDPTSFRAVLLHELAHIRNRDVSITYLALSIWWAFLATGLLPYTLIDLRRPQTALDLILLASDLTLLSLCVLLTRNAVLRARELYADARSFAWHRDTAGLAKVLARLNPVPRWRRLLSSHPAPARRRRLIEDTDEMFRFGAWDSFGVGLAAGISGFFLLPVTANLINSTSGYALLLAFGIPALIVIPVAAGAMAVGVWRATFLALMRGRRHGSRLRTSFACAIGAIAGGGVQFVLVFAIISAGLGPASGMLPRISASLPTLILAGAAMCLVFISGLTLALIIFFAWIGATAQCWLGTRLLGSRPGPAFVLLLALCLFVAALWVVFVLLSVGTVAYLVYEERFSNLFAIFWRTSVVALVFPLSLIVWVGVVGFWLIPLSAALWPRRLPGTAFWTFPDDTADTTPDFPIPSVRLQRAALLGVASGVTAVLAAIWLPIPLPAGSLHGSGFSETDVVANKVARLLTGELAQGLVAMLTVLVIPRLAVLHAMCAAFIAGCVFAMSVVLYLRLPAYGGMPFGAAADISLCTLLGGTLVALAFGSITHLLATPVRWFLQRHSRAYRDPRRTVILS